MEGMQKGFELQGTVTAGMDESKELSGSDIDPPNTAPAVHGFTENDRRDMHRMGKNQELMRNFRLISTVGFTTCVMGTWEILLTANTQGLIAGGMAGLFWSLCWCYVGQTFVVLSLAEMASMAPTAGGQYHWVSEFAPRKYQKWMSYTSGWLATLSWQSIVAADCYIVGGIVQGLIVVADPNYVPERWQATLLIIASAIGIGLFNIYGAKHLPLAEGIFATFHVFAFFPVIAVLWAMAPKQSAHAVFVEFTDNGAGWPTTAWAVMVGQVSSMFAVIGSDSVAHISEEIEDAGVIVPRGMMWAFLLNIPLTFGLLLTYLFCIGDVTEALGSTTGYPFIYVFSNATQSRGGTIALVVVVLLLLIMITISSLASSSRQIWAFSRDRGLPFSGWLSHVHPSLQIPANSIIFTCLYTILLSLINIGSSVGFNAVLSLTSSALMATYLISIGSVTYKRLTRQPLPTARWSLGRYGLLVNCSACLYAFWAFFWSFWPNSYQPTAQTFNWSSVLFSGVMIIAALVYVFWARKVYEGPVAKVRW